jgi:hypothetical protein
MSRIVEVRLLVTSISASLEEFSVLKQKENA